MLGQTDGKKDYHDFMSRLAATKRSTSDLVACVIGLAVGSSVNYAQAVAQLFAALATSPQLLSPIVQ